MMVITSFVRAEQTAHRASRSMATRARSVAMVSMGALSGRPRHRVRAQWACQYGKSCIAFPPSYLISTHILSACTANGSFRGYACQAINTFLHGGPGFSCTPKSPSGMDPIPNLALSTESNIRRCVCLPQFKLPWFEQLWRPLPVPIQRPSRTSFSSGTKDGVYLSHQITLSITSSAFRFYCHGDGEPVGPGKEALPALCPFVLTNIIC
jgi:hypothetical protein